MPLSVRVDDAVPCEVPLIEGGDEYLRVPGSRTEGPYARTFGRRRRQSWSAPAIERTRQPAMGKAPVRDGARREKEAMALAPEFRACR